MIIYLFNVIKIAIEVRDLRSGLGSAQQSQSINDLQLAEHLKSKNEKWRKAKLRFDSS